MHLQTRANEVAFQYVGIERVKWTKCIAQFQNHVVEVAALSGWSRKPYP